MIEMSIWQKIVYLFNLIMESPLFITLLITFFITVISLIISYKVKNKAVRLITALIYISIFIFVIIKYGKSILSLGDNFIEKIFTSIYFPSLITYICMMIITTLLLIMTILNKRLSKFIRLCNIFCFTILEFLFILTLDVVISENIDIYAKTAVYSNKTLLVLIQSSMGVFSIWCLALLINGVVRLIMKLSSKKNNKEIPNTKVPDIPNTVLPNSPEFEPEDFSLEENADLDVIETRNSKEDFEVILTEKGFEDSYKKKRKQKKYKKYLNYTNLDDKFK